jgi:hypothetical protein
MQLSIRLALLSSAQAMKKCNLPSEIENWSESCLAFSAWLARNGVKRCIAMAIQLCQTAVALMEYPDEISQF